MISGRSSETTYEQTENLKPGKDLFGDGGAAEHVPALEHEHLASRAGQVGGAGQPVVPAADDDRVVTHRRNYLSARSPSARKPCQARQ